MVKKAVFIVMMLFLTSACSHKELKADFKSEVSSDEIRSALIRYEFPKGELIRQCESNLDSFREKIKQWRQLSKGHEKEPITILKFESQISDLKAVMEPLTFLANVSRDENVRTESAQCSERYNIANNEVFTNRENYDLIKSIKTSDPNESRLVHEIKSAFERNGLRLSDSKLQRVKDLLDQLTKLSVEFEQNLNNDTSFITVSSKDLAGASLDFVSRLRKDSSGLFIVETKHPNYIHIMENVSVRETRQRMQLAYQNRQGEKNTKILQAAIQLRSQMAQTLGYKTFADYALEDRMAKRKEVVSSFLSDLQSKLIPKVKEEKAALAAFKKSVLKDDSPLEQWDLLYVENQIRKQKYAVDGEQVREYFPADHVISQTLQIYSELFGVQFEKIGGIPLWSPDVSLFKVVDKTTKQTVAYFYADLIPREGKYGHAAATSLRAGRTLLFGNGTYQKPIAAIMANFTPSTPTRPSLLTHEEVETFFHEFGHIMHSILTKAPYGLLSGFEVKRDFTEAPSQMLENWVWDSATLKALSGHYKNTDEKLPDLLIEKMKAAKLFDSGLKYIRQVVLARFDQEIHTHPEKDVTQTFRNAYQSLVGLDVIEGSHFPASFGHMMSDLYTAGYYGYLWSQVYAEDMFSVFEAKGLMNSEVGLKYRKIVLEQGNMKDPEVLLKGFLGRKPNNKAFLKSIGL